jgi:hypothetical protein
VDPPALVVLPLGPQVAQVRHHALGEQARGMPRLLVGLVAVVEQAEHVADPQRLDQLLHALADGLGAARDDHAALDQVLPRDVLEELLVLAAQDRQRAGPDRLDRPVAGRVREAGVDPQAPVVEVEDVLGVEPLGLLVGVGDRDELGERRAVR